MRGNTGSAPPKVLDEKGLAEGTQRWRFIPLHKRLAETSARPSALITTDYSLNLEDVAPDDTLFSHFATTLESQSDENITAAFVEFCDVVKPLSLSLPLLYRNRARLVDLCLQSLRQNVQSGGLTFAAVASCLSALAKDLGADETIPFLPRIVSAFAYVLDAGRHSNLSGDSEQKKQHSLFWQPDVVLIPLFTALSELTKSLVVHLALKPLETLVTLLPLLSHPHYRVREMTAEACLGYVVRKTRNDSGRHLLVKHIVAFGNREFDDGVILTNVVDGLGVTLSEAVCLPSRRLHSRAMDILSVALRTLPGHTDNDAALNGDGVKSAQENAARVVARCFASVSRRVVTGSDVQSLANLLLLECDVAFSASDEGQVATIFFLFRKWIHFGQTGLLSTLGMVFGQRLINVIVRGLETFTDIHQLIFESFGFLGMIYSHAAESFRENSVVRAFTKALDIVAKGSCHAALLSVLRILMDEKFVTFSVSSLRRLSGGFASLSNRIADLHEGRDDDASNQNTAISLPCLHLALKFFRRVTGGAARFDKSFVFRAPALESHVVGVLSSLVGIRRKCDERMNGNASSSLFRQTLEYLSFVRVAGCASLLKAIFAQRHQWDFVDSARFLSACACQRGYGEADDAGLISECARGVIDAEILPHCEVWKSVAVCSSAIRYIGAFGRGIVDEDGREDAKSTRLSLRGLRRTLMENMSSIDVDLRQTSAELLKFCDSDYRIDSPFGIDGDTQEKIHLLRNALTGDDASLHRLCACIQSIFKVSRTLDDISGNSLVIQELARLVRQIKVFDEDIFFLLMHFALGLFQMPLKPLWRPAGDFFMALVEKKTDAVMTVACSHLKRSSMALLSEGSASVSEDDEIDLVNDANGNEGNNAEPISDGNGVSDVLLVTEEGSPQNDSEPIRRGKKRKKQSASSLMLSKKQRTKALIVERAHWNPSEWRLEEYNQVSPMGHGSSNSNSQMEHSAAGFTDPLTFIVEMLGVFSKEPKYTLNFRSDLIFLYLTLRPSLFSRNRGNTLALSFTSLLEKMGGLKCTGTNNGLEVAMRERLLSDITRSAQSLQVSALWCLCASRSPSVKPYRDSFLRLIEEATFREELALMTETQFAEWNMSADATFSEGQETVLDVLIRICFSKLTAGKRYGKSAVLSFVTSKLPWDFALAKITTLLLDPVKDGVHKLVKHCGDDSLVDTRMPPVSVQIGLLSSIEAVVKNCRRTLPVASWKEVALAVLLFLQKAGKGSSARDVRGRALRLLSQMNAVRPEDCAFITMRVLSAVRESAFDSGSAKGTNGAPACLCFLSSIYKTSALDILNSVFETNQWTISFCIQVLQSPASDPNSIELTMDIISRFIFYAQERRSGEGWTAISSVLKNVAISLNQLLARLFSSLDCDRSAQKKWSNAFDASLEAVQSLLSVFPSAANLLSSLAEDLSLFLQHWTSSNLSSVSVLKTLDSIMRSIFTDGKANSGSGKIAVSQLYPLLSARRFIRNNESYCGLCDLIATVGSDDFGVVAKILKDLNSMNQSRIGEPDLDRRIEALNLIVSLFKEGLGGSDDGSQSDACDIFVEIGSINKRTALISSDGVTALCHGCIAAVHVKDSAVRGTAGYALKLISRWVAFSQSGAAVSCRSSLLRQYLKSAVYSRRLVHRRELCAALGEFTRCCLELPNEDQSQEESVLFNHLKSLCSDSDLDVDFFENLVHLQPHRRSRALRQLEKHISESTSKDEFDVRMFSSTFVMPLGMQIAMDQPDMDDDKKRRNPKNFMAKEDAQKDVSVWAVNCVGRAASFLSWVEYRNCLNNLLRKISTIEDEGNVAVLYKMLVKVCEAFPKCGQTRYPEETAVQEYLINTLLPKMLPHVSSGATSNDLVHDSERSSRLVEVGGQRRKPQSSFRAPVAIAVGQLMSQLPEESMETMMPLLVTPLVTALRSRMRSLSDSAKKALSSVSLILGSKYLPYVLRQIFSVLDEGFRKDMCIFVIHSLLQGIREYSIESTRGGGAKFEVNNCVELIGTQILNELRDGESENRKDFEDPNASDARLRKSSAKATKAFECAELLGELINFSQSANALCSPWLNVLSSTTSGKLVGRLVSLMQRLLFGFSKNSSMTIESAFKFCYELVSATSERELDTLLANPALKKLNRARSPKIKQFRWTNFGLQLFSSVLAKNANVLNEGTERAALLHSMCEPFLQLSTAALKLAQDDLTLTSFRVLQKLLKLPLSGRKAVADEMSKVIVDVLSNHSNGLSATGELSATNDLFNTCLRAAAVLLKEVGTEYFSIIPRERVDVLLAVTCDCVENGSVQSRSASISLLRAAVTAKIMLPSVYDAIEKVNRLAIHAQSSSLRSACVSVSISFFLSFPLGSKRLRQHLEFFVRNINYELASGRIAALQAIRELVLKFPPEVLQAESEYLFVALTANIARDDDRECRDLAFDCVRTLFLRLPPGRYFVALLSISSTLIGVQCSMTSFGEELFRLEDVDPGVMQSGFASLSAACKSGRLSTLQLKLIGQCAVVSLEGLGEDEEWESIFALLHCVEALFEAQVVNKLSRDRLEKQDFMRDLWDEIGKLLLHRNQWVRLISSRLVGCHLSSWGGRKVTPGVTVEEGLFCVWEHNDMVRDWVKAFCLQLEADHLAIELGEQCLKNVLCMSDVIRNYPMVGDVGKDIMDDVDPERAVTDQMSVENGDGTGNEVSQEEVGRTLKWLLGRVSGLALKRGKDVHDLLRRACALRFLLVTAKWWGAEIVQMFKRRYIWPAVKVLESGETSATVENSGLHDRRKHMRFRSNGKDRDRNTGGGDESNATGEEEEEEDGDNVGVRGLRKIAEGLQLVLLGIVGSEDYYAVYREVSKKRTEAKMDRKRKHALLTAADPERTAKRKRMKAKMRKVRLRSSQIGKPRDFDGKNDEDSHIDQNAREKRRLTEDL